MSRVIAIVFVLAFFSGHAFARDDADAYCRSATKWADGIIDLRLEGVPVYEVMDTMRARTPNAPEQAHEVMRQVITGIYKTPRYFIQDLRSDYLSNFYMSCVQSYRP